MVRACNWGMQPQGSPPYMLWGDTLVLRIPHYFNCCTQLTDLLDKSGKELNPSLEPREVMHEEARCVCVGVVGGGGKSGKGGFVSNLVSLGWRGGRSGQVCVVGTWSGGGERVEGGFVLLSYDFILCPGLAYPCLPDPLA